MYNVQINLAHNKQTHCQPKFPENNMDNKKNSSTNKDWKKKSHLEFG